MYEIEILRTEMNLTPLICKLCFLSSTKSTHKINKEFVKNKPVVENMTSFYVIDLILKMPLNKQKNSGLKSTA